MVHDIEAAVEAAWMEAEDLVVERELHPEDEMYIGVEGLRAEPTRRRSEYMRSGLEAALVLDHVLASAGRDWGGVGSLLEFASGFGRTTRFLVQRLAPERIVSADILPGSAEWLHERFGVRGFRSCTDPADLPLTERFDLIWVGSLFSHLPLARFEALLRRLFEALTPSGLLVFSTHGADKVPSMEKHPQGFSFHRESESRSLSLDEYGATFVTPDRMQALARGVGIEQLARVDRHLWTIQDVWVASHAPLPAFPENAPIARGRVLRADVSPAGHGWIGGYVRMPSYAGPIGAVEVRLGGHGYAALLAEPERIELESSGAPESFLNTEWYLEGELAGLAPGLHPLGVVATSASGRRHCIEAREVRVP